MYKVLFRFLSFFFINKEKRHWIRSYESFSIKKLLNYKKLNYKVISLGTFCLPRVISTSIGIKPHKWFGELTCPFDLAFFNNFDQILMLLNNNFENFFDGLKYSNKNNYYYNDNLSAIFNHDGTLSLEEFKNRYKKRIKNFIKYIKSDSFIYFLIAFQNTQNIPSDTQLKILINTLHKIRNNKKFKVIIITAEKEPIITTYPQKISVISKITYSFA
jgi:hypothetical protein